MFYQVRRRRHQATSSDNSELSVRDRGLSCSMHELLLRSDTQMTGIHWTPARKTSKKPNKRVHTERRYTRSVMMQSVTPSGDAQGVICLYPSVRAQLRGCLLVTEVQQDEKTISVQQNSSIERLIEALQHAPNRKWMEEYLDLVNDLLTFTELKESDPRLVLSPTKGFGIAVTVNRRHVLTSRRDRKSWTGFIFKFDCTQLPEMLNMATRSGQFDPHPGEISGQTPYVLRFEGSPKDLLTQEQKTEWKEAVLIELQRGKSSPYKKKWHDPYVYKIATDLEHRALVLDKAFADSLANQPEEASPFFTERKVSYLSIERTRVEAEGYFNIENLEDARRRTTVSIVQRQGQPEFRHKLLKAYNSRCPITGCDAEPAIEAAHIIPYQGAETNHLTNGLPLRADVHTLFDLNLLSVQPATYEIVVAPELSETCYQELAGRKLTLPEHEVAAPNQDALKKHYEFFLQRCGKEQQPDR
jgi:hypothetical protein